MNLTLIRKPPELISPHHVAALTGPSVNTETQYHLLFPCVYVDFNATSGSGPPRGVPGCTRH